MSFSWRTPPEQAFGELTDAYIRTIQAAIGELALRRAPDIEAWMKLNAPWTDRTTNARQTLHTEVERLSNDAVTILLAHGMAYGLYLELSNAGRYSVIGPALDYWAPIIWNDVLSLFRS